GFSPVAPAELPFDVPLTPFTLDLALIVGCFVSVCFVALEPSCWTSLTLLIVYSYLRVSDFTNWNNHYYLNILELALFTITDSEYAPSGPSDDHNHSADLKGRERPEVMDTADSLLSYSSGIQDDDSAFNADGAVGTVPS
ncbi:hypothetical protein FOZ63_025072, partial [Perkinsus olseni]